ncbi:unnamed protein product, partial [Discosporangium mesarthrocarpum]
AGKSGGGGDQASSRSMDGVQQPTTLSKVADLARDKKNEGAGSLEEVWAKASKTRQGKGKGQLDASAGPEVKSRARGRKSLPKKGSPSGKGRGAGVSLAQRKLSKEGKLMPLAVSQEGEGMGKGGKTVSLLDSEEGSDVGWSTPPKGGAGKHTASFLRAKKVEGGVADSTPSPIPNPSPKLAGGESTIRRGRRGVPGVEQGKAISRHADKD